MSGTKFARRTFRKTLTDGLYKFGSPFLVPTNIPQPHAKRETQFAQLLSASQIESARLSAQIAASALRLALDLAQPGVTTESIDTEVSQYIVSRGAYPSGIGFMGFPKSICTAVNEVVAHGIPDSRPLQDGDIVNFDVTAYINGYYGDNSDMALIGEVDEAGKKLVNATRDALSAAISVCGPGRKFSEIGDAISQVASANNFQVVDYFCGHFIGTEMHIAPNIHHVSGKMDLVMQEGMLFTIEPILVEGSTKAHIWKDGWTYVTKDNGRTAQAEHMIIITKTGYDILTKI